MTPKEKFILFSALADTPRTGWVQRGIVNPESVAEHIYGCWLLATFLLPETHSIPEYNKNTVLQMLLLHDLPEAVTGDIPRPQKKQNPAYYERLEAEAVQNSLLAGDYTEMQRQLWHEWSEQNTYNALVAKDIDNLQAIYLSTVLRKKHPKSVAESDAQNWLNGLRNLHTDLGQKIAETLFEE